MEDNYNINDILQKNEEINPEKKALKKKKRLPSWARILIWFLSIITAAVLISTVVIVGTGEYLGIGPGRGVKCTVQIDKGMSTRQIAAELKESGAIGNELAFRIFSKLKGFDGKYSYGVYSFNNEIGYNDLAKKLMSEGQKAETVTVVIPEGTGINDYTKNVNGKNVTVPGIATLLENAGVCSKKDFFAALDKATIPSSLSDSINKTQTYYALEGYLFPNTYNFYSYDSKECAVLAVEKMLKESDKRITEDMRKKAESMGYSINEILTMASIIQMESGLNTTDMPGVAAVFYNRLNNSASFPTLGSSPTCYYGDSFKNDDGRYNTYNVKGLPPGPLCSPGIAAINAALNPTENSPYYYFVTDSTGKFYFHKTLSEQNATINRLKQGNNWIYEYFN